MSGPAPRRVAAPPAAPRAQPGLTEPAWVRWTLITIVVLFLGSFLLMPLAVVFATALRAGWRAYLAALSQPAALSAIRLTLIAAGWSLALNTLFGVAAAWAITRFRFPGKALLITLIDLPFAVSPVISGLIFVLLFGLQGWAKNQPLHHVWPIAFWSLIVGAAWLAVAAARAASRRDRGRSPWTRAIIAAALVVIALAGNAWLAPWLAAGNDLTIIFAAPGIVIATVFVTFPFVARELIPVMQSVGQEEEQAALSLGASGWTTFRRVTLPNVKWGLLYGMILCNARAMGEYGAVNVVSGNIRGRTETMPLHIENLFDDNQIAAAFAVASLLALLALVTLIAKTWLEARIAAPPPSDGITRAPEPS